MKSNYCPFKKIKCTLGPYTVYDDCISDKSEIYLAYNSDVDKKCCVKIIKVKDKVEYKKQIDIHQQIQLIVHKNLIRVYQIIFYDDCIYVFQEFCDMSLSDQDKNTIPYSSVNPMQIWDFILQISNGYIALIKNNIIHRDLKPDNILVNIDLKKNRLIYKICDFGLCKTNQSSRMQTPVTQGTAAYAAPEINQCQFSFAADIFSFGLILLEILIQKSLDATERKQLNYFLKQNSLKQWFDEGQQQQYERLNILNKLKKIDSKLLELLDNLLFYDPNKRTKWELLNSKVQDIVNQLTLQPNQQDLNPKNTLQQATCQTLAQVQINAEYYKDQPTSENSQYSQSSVVNKNSYETANKNQQFNPQIYNNSPQKPLKTEPSQPNLNLNPIINNKIFQLQNQQNYKNSTKQNNNFSQQQPQQNNNAQIKQVNCPAFQNTDQKKV